MSFKNEYLKKYGITARQFNSIRCDLQGNIDSAKRIISGRIINLKDNIGSVSRLIKNRQAKIRKTTKDKNLNFQEKKSLIHQIRFQLHQKKRKLHSLEQKLQKLKTDKSRGKIRICFGSKKFFHKQFNLRENNYLSHEQWLKDYKQVRSSTFMFLGSKDETAGNQTSTLSDNGVLRVRVPDCLIDKYGRYISISGVKYPYGQDIIDKALDEGNALTYRFVRKKKGWYLHTTVEYPEIEKVTHHPRDIGCIGVDFNEKQVAVGETGRFGNLTWHKSYSACVRDKSSRQTEAIYGDVAKIIVDRAIEVGKPIAYETLDFQKKKTTLKEDRKGYARMLSRLAYCTFLTMLERRAYRNGVEVYRDNPAFTSVIGKINFMSRYGISPHESAALVIARRIQRYSESPSPSRTAFPLPARNRGKHVWTFWRRLKDSGVCNEHHRLYSRRSLQDSVGGTEKTVPSSQAPAVVESNGKALGVVPTYSGESGPYENQGENP